MKLEAAAVSKHFRLDGGTLTALENVSLSVRPGEFVSLVGPSGCGKSTLFNILAGLELPDGGNVRIDGMDVTGRLGLVAYMPQKDLLLPWKSVLDNTVVGARLRGISKADARREALAWFHRFGLQGFERSYPAALSGGMRQRAALLRTLLCRREILLLDEPFGALDALTRIDMQTWLVDIRRELDNTIVLITHDVDEAIYLSDRVFVMSSRPGRVLADVPILVERRGEHEETATSPAFVGVKRDLLRLLRPNGAHEEVA
ncbi:MAG: ABC transporter ATP-binding protein [Chloroflexota bacterium]|nr:MAG: ABC transporter [Chloroflexota bacterium]